MFQSLLVLLVSKPFGAFSYSKKIKKMKQENKIDECERKWLKKYQNTKKMLIKCEKEKEDFQETFGDIKRFNEFFDMVLAGKDKEFLKVLDELIDFIKIKSYFIESNKRKGGKRNYKNKKDLKFSGSYKNNVRINIKILLKKIEEIKKNYSQQIKTSEQLTSADKEGELLRSRTDETPSLKEIQELVERYNTIKNTKTNSIVTGVSKLNELAKIKQKAQKYKEILEKGCGKVFSPPIPIKCGEPSVKFKGEEQQYYLCPECQEKLKLLNEVLEDLK